MIIHVTKEFWSAMPTKPTTFNPNAHIRKLTRAAKRADKFYSSAAWIRVRNLVRSEEPTCRRCSELFGTLSATEEIDHIVPRKQCPERELDRSNLRGLCKVCHSQVRREQGV